MKGRTIHTLTIADGDWMRPENNDDRLTTVIVINGTFHHLDAIRVIENEDGVLGPAATAFEETLDTMYQLGGDGPFDTVTIRGHAYVLVVIPFQ